MKTSLKGELLSWRMFVMANSVYDIYLQGIMGVLFITTNTQFKMMKECNYQDYLQPHLIGKGSLHRYTQRLLSGILRQVRILFRNMPVLLTEKSSCRSSKCSNTLSKEAAYFLLLLFCCCCFFLRNRQQVSMVYRLLYNNPSYSRILIGSRL